MSLKVLPNIKKQFLYYKSLGDKSLAQISDEQLFWQYNADSNSMAIIAKHMAGNMLSRWTDFMTTDGEKEWRHRDQEFINHFDTRAALLAYWEKGWACLFTAIDPLTTDDLTKEVFIRNMGCTVIDAINRQLAHYAYHVGQLVFLAKMHAGQNWESLSIPRNASASYNEERFSREQETKHFTSD